MTFRSHDPIRGRLRFVLKGDLDISSGVTFSSENLTQQRTLVDTTIELPVYTNDPNTPSDQILLEAEKVITHQQGEERAQVDGLLKRQRGRGLSPNSKPATFKSSGQRAKESSLAALLLYV